MPDKKCFYSSVKDGTTGDNGEKLHGHINDKDVDNIWRWAKFETNLTWKIWVIITTNIWKSIYCCLLMFINTCLKFYKLDPCHYFNTPEFSWDAMLKMTGVKLEKILDIDI